MHPLTYDFAYHVDSTILAYFIYTATYIIYIYLCIMFLGIV
jgi:hypothetical protein